MFTPAMNDMFNEIFEVPRECTENKFITCPEVWKTKSGFGLVDTDSAKKYFFTDQSECNAILEKHNITSYSIYTWSTRENRPICLLSI